MRTAKEGVLDWEINKNKEEEATTERGREREREMETVKRLMLKQMFSSRIMAAIIVNENLVPSLNYNRPFTHTHTHTHTYTHAHTYTIFCSEVFFMLLLLRATLSLLLSQGQI